MLDIINTYIQQQQLFNKKDTLLLAVSGGIDSMVLLHILKTLEYNIAVAHCNFNLRGEESNADEQFIKHYCKTNKIPFFTKSFDTNVLKKSTKQSTQMLARDLRYTWFETLLNDNNFQYIVTAHHLNDQLETILLNLTKGTGLSGLKGMLPKNNFVVRPLLSVTKSQIIAYAKQHQITYREDSSNASNNYQRNLIRHEVVPILEQINPNVLSTINDFSTYISEYNYLVNDDLMHFIKKKCVVQTNFGIAINIGYIKKHQAAKTILFHLIKVFNFNSTQIDAVCQCILLQESGKQFFSATHRLVIDRKQLLIIALENDKTNYLLFEKIPKVIQFNNYKIQCKLAPIEKVNIKKSKNYAYLDADKVQLPLLIRYWKEGDYFYPFGMSKPKHENKVGKKKLSKYFKDEKFSLLEKEQTAVLFSNQHLIWLVGQRIDDRFKVTANTKTVLKLKIVKQ